MASLRDALQQLEVSAQNGLRDALPVRPPGGPRELIRVATLPVPRLADLEPDAPRAFESFEVEDPQGLAHGGGDRWFLSSQSSVERCTIEGRDPFRPTGLRRGDRRSLRALLQEAGLAAAVPFFDHVGDLNFASSLVYAPIRRSGGEGPNLMLGLSRDLRVVGWAELPASAGESTCAVNPWSGLLYVPGRDDTGRLEAHGVSAFVRRLGEPSRWGRRLEVVPAPRANIQLRTPAGDDDGEGLQGMSFSANGRIYVTRSGDEPYVNRISVYSALTGRRFGARRWDFPGDGDEIEGVAVHPAGVLYVAVNENDLESPFSQDDFELCTFRFRTLEASEV
jgi:hypothetical protein